MKLEIYTKADGTEGLRPVLLAEGRKFVRSAEAIEREKQFKEATKLWQIFGIAIGDMEACYVDPRYTIDMNYWHEGQCLRDDNEEDRRCAVCVAGSVMAQTLRFDPTRDGSPNEFGVDLYQKCVAIDTLRRGAVVGAYRAFYNITGIGDTNIIEALSTLEWDLHSDALRFRRRFRDENDFKQFVGSMNKIADRLQELDI